MSTKTPVSLTNYLCLGESVYEKDKKYARDSAGFGHFLFFLVLLISLRILALSNRYRYTADASSVEKIIITIFTAIFSDFFQ